MTNLVDKKAYDEFYQGKHLDIKNVTTPSEYINFYEYQHLSPFYQGGTTKGYVRGVSVKKLFQEIEASGKSIEDISVLDAGSGQGGLSCYLASKGLNVIGVDISESACEISEALAVRIGVQNQVKFLAASLESIPIDDASVDYIIGHAALHHFIKYEGCAEEFWRVLKPGGSGFFADSFGENRIYHLFHNKAQMERLGDVILTRNMIKKYFNKFEVKLLPTDWFVMFDKLYLKLLPNKFDYVLRKISSVHFFLDRMVSAFKSTSIALFLSGAIMTEIKKPL